MSRNSGSILMSITVGKEEKGWLEHVIALLEKIFHHHVNLHKRANAYRIQTRNRNICKLLQEIGFSVGKKALTVKIPSMIVNGDATIRKAFIKGYFDADGCLCFDKHRGRCGSFKRTRNYYPKIHLYSASKDFIVSVQKMLELLGFRCRINKQMPRRKGQHVLYVAVVRGPMQLNLWMKEIGSSNPVHLTKYKVWKKFGFCPSKTMLAQRLTMLESFSSLVTD